MDKKTEPRASCAPPRSQSWRRAKPGREHGPLWLRTPRPGPPQALDVNATPPPQDVRALATAVLCFLCPCPLRFLPGVLRNHRTAVAARQRVRRLAAARGKQKRKIRERFPSPGDRGPGWLWEDRSAPTPGQPSFAPPFAAPGGAPACRVPRLGEATLPGNAGSWSARAGPGREGGPGRSGLAPCSAGPLHLPWGPPEGRGPGLCDTLSRASQSPDPRCLQALGGELGAQRPN